MHSPSRRVAQGQRGEAGLLGAKGNVEPRGFHRPVVRMDEVEHLDAFERGCQFGAFGAAAGGAGEVDAPVDDTRVASGESSKSWR